jgi:hypothetical protein
MANEKQKQPDEMVSVPATMLRELQSRLDVLERERNQPAPNVASAATAELQARIASLEHDARVRAEMLDPKNKLILDKAFEDWKLEASRPAKDRTQDIVDKTYGTAEPRFRVYLDSSTEENGVVKKGPSIGEHPELVISAHGDLEAGAIYLKVCGISSHKHRLMTLPANQPRPTRAAATAAMQPTT